MACRREPSPLPARRVQLARMPISKPSSTSCVSAPMMRDSRMLPTRSYTASSCGTQLSWMSTHFIPILAATAATIRVWFDCTPPIETNVSALLASASGMMYSSLRSLLPPNASPELQSSRLAKNLYIAAKMGSQARQLLDRSGSEGQLIALELGKHRDRSSDSAQDLNIPQSPGCMLSIVVTWRTTHPMQS